MYKIVENSVFKLAKQFVGISVRFISKDKIDLSLITLIRKGKEVELSKEINNIEDIKNLSKEIPVGVPIILNIDGWGVLFKENTGNRSNQDSSELFSLSYPKLNDNKTYNSILREKVIIDLLEKFNESKIDPTYISFGPYDLLSLVPFFGGSKTETISTTTWAVTVDRGQIIKICNNRESSDNLSTIFDKKISGSSLQVYSSILCFLSDKAIETKFSKENKSNFIYSRLTSIIGLSALLTIFIALLINYFVFEHVSKTNNSLSENMNMNEQLFTEFKELSSKYQKKQEIAKRFGGVTTSLYLSEIGDQLAQTMPTAIKLTSIEIQPIDGSVKQGKQIVYQNESLSITGASNHIEDVNRWIDSIRDKDWVKDVGLKSFDNDGVKIAVFSIFISLKDR